MEAPLSSASSASVWKQQPASRLSYLCTVPNCYSVCHSSRLLTPIRRLLQLRCGDCTHPHLSHSHTRHEWVKVIDPQTSVDEREKKRRAAAKDEKEQTEALIATSEEALARLNHAIDEAIDDLGQSTEEYIALSLFGSFSIHVEKAIRLLEERYTDMAKKGASKKQLKKTQDSLSLMKRKLVLLRYAEEKAQKET